MTEAILKDHYHIWQQKPVLREIYHDYYQRICAVATTGLTLEVGGGSGNLKEYLPEVITTDIVTTPWLDISCDAQTLPFRTASFSNIVGMDVLHHIERPIRFLREAQRLLKPGGRLILLEPAITPISWIFYNFFHEEPVILKDDPLADGPLTPGRKPFDANQAIPSLLVGKYRQELAQKVSQLSLKNVEYLSLWAYPLSGGFKRWCLVPRSWLRSLLVIEKSLERLLGRVMGFRLLIVLEKVE
jgi:SAM-dependent methyltransferase